MSNKIELRETNGRPFAYYVEHVGADPVFLSGVSVVPTGRNYKITPLYESPDGVTEEQYEYAAGRLLYAFDAVLELGVTKEQAREIVDFVLTETFGRAARCARDCDCVVLPGDECPKGLLRAVEVDL